MTTTTPAAEMRELAHQLERHNHLYHNLDHDMDAPEIGDAEYDQLFERLVQLVLQSQIYSVRMSPQ